MTELEKLLAGELYDYSDTQIAQLHGKAYFLSMKINNNLSFDNLEEMELLQEELLPSMDETSTVLPPFRCDLGFRIKIGRNVTVNQKFQYGMKLGCTESWVGLTIFTCLLHDDRLDGIFCKAFRIIALVVRLPAVTKQSAENAQTCA